MSCNTVTDSNPCSIDSSNCQPPPPCTTGQTQNCGSEVGICTPGQQQCTAGGEWSECTGGIPPAGEETCDALDNDCDGSTDEGCPLTLTSPAFNKGDVIPTEYTCQAKDAATNLPTNPSLLISNIPAGTESLALFLEDVDQPTAGRLPTVHWAVFNIPVSADNPVTPLDESALVAIPEGYPGTTSGILQAQNDLPGDQGYAPPCPPTGKSHEYHFSVYALRVANIVTAASFNLQNVLTSTAFKDTVSGNIIQEAGLISYYPTRPAAAPGPAPSPAGGGGGGSGGARGGGRVGWNCPMKWSTCKNGLEQRTCTDMFNPVITRIETRPCVVTAPPAPPKPVPVVQPPKPVPLAPPKPVQVIQQPAEMKVPAVQKPAPVLLMIKDLWQKYKVYVVAVPSALLVIITLILLVHHFRKPKVVYNLEELKQWIKAEKAMGTSDENVKAILAQNTGWSKEEIEKAMSEALGVRSAAPPAASTMPPSS